MVDVRKSVRKMIKSESKADGRRIEKVFAEAELLIAANGPTKPGKKTRELERIAGSPYHPGAQQARDELHDRLGKKAYARGAVRLWK
jgi:hypothetical protein